MAGVAIRRKAGRALMGVAGGALVPGDDDLVSMIGDVAHDRPGRGNGAEGLAVAVLVVAEAVAVGAIEVRGRRIAVGEDRRLAEGGPAEHSGVGRPGADPVGVRFVAIETPRHAEVKGRLGPNVDITAVRSVVVVAAAADGLLRVAPVGLAGLVEHAVVVVVQPVAGTAAEPVVRQVRGERVLVEGEALRVGAVAVRDGGGVTRGAGGGAVPVFAVAGGDVVGGDDVADQRAVALGDRRLYWRCRRDSPGASRAAARCRR